MKGISLFIVPKFLVDDDGSLGERNDVVLAGLNHKMGYRGTTNTLLNFGEGVHRPGGRAGAVGYLVGEPHRGLTYMFHMMNEARIGVGLGATVLGYTGYLHALDYARTRTAGPPGRRARTRPRRRCRSSSTPTSGGCCWRRSPTSRAALALGAVLRAAGRRGADRRDRRRSARRAHLLLEMLTPDRQGWPSQWCLEADDLAIQVHGGYGYTRDYPVEQFYRDNRLNPIHEGTHGIQALDLLGRKVVHAGRRRARAAGRDASARPRRGPPAPSGPASPPTSTPPSRRLGAVTATAVGAPATPTSRWPTRTSTWRRPGTSWSRWLWLEQALATGTATSDFHEGKRQAARYFCRWELPRVHHLDLLESLDRTVLDTDETLVLNRTPCPGHTRPARLTEGAGGARSVARLTAVGGGPIASASGPGRTAGPCCSRSYRAVDRVPIAMTRAVRTRNPIRATAGHRIIVSSPPRFWAAARQSGGASSQTLIPRLEPRPILGSASSPPRVCPPDLVPACPGPC